MKSKKPNKVHYPALDGLRGIAILLVVVFHNFGFTKYFFFGWLGVDLFFVLSGFLITGILLKTVGKPNYLSNFYLKRVLRIFPLYYLFLIICLLVLPAIPVLKEQMKYYSDNQWWFWFFFQNWFFVINPPEHNNLLIHLWSLAVEEQFYLLWPFVVLLVRRPKALLAIALSLLVAVMATRSILWFAKAGETLTFNLYIFIRIDGICIGCALALIRHIYPQFIRNNTAIIVIFFSVLNLIFFFLNRVNNFLFPYYAFIGYTTFALLFAILVNEAVSNNSGWVATVFKNNFLKFIGKVSYGFYLIHWPIYKFLFGPLLSWLKNNVIQNDTFARLLSASIATLLGFLLSVLSYRYFEKWFLDLKPKLTTN